MGLPADVSLLTVLFKAATLVALVIAAMALLRSSHVDRTPKLAARREARRKPYVSPFAVPLPPQPVAPRLEAGTELTKLARVLEAASQHVQAVHVANRTAAREIDGAEMALNRLLHEITGVMPEVIAPTIVPRRALSLVTPQTEAVAA